ncbi:uncharacterized protein LOC115309015 [Ixodes scapularis]|uniref:uncharacterized protein LOC115309015 n=1 Tax=Ixodes scapularis TaxID=6945 RepID=UPI001C38810B|nr:uncharacterized protein LOC115309015 [Ixodes scapularis]
MANPGNGTLGNPEQGSQHDAARRRQLFRPAPYDQGIWGAISCHRAWKTTALPTVQKIGHIRKQCRALKCNKCNKFGHEDNECYATYATVLRRGDEDAESNLDQFMDVSEVLGANGEVGASTGGPANSLPSVPGETGAISDHQPQDPGAIPVSSQTGDDSSMEQGSDCSAATPSELNERDQGETKQAGPLPEGQGNGVDTHSALGTGVSDVKRNK